MTDKTYDAEDPRELPYRFTCDPVTSEWFIIGIGHGFSVLGYFENDPSFYRFLLEGLKAYDNKQGGILKEASRILENTQEGKDGSNADKGK